MAEGTKERILRIALELFAQNGYLGTSMNDIAGRLGFTKAALYKHYAGKQEILDKIVERMNKMDYERAEAYAVSFQSYRAVMNLDAVADFRLASELLRRRLSVGKVKLIEIGRAHV